MNEKLILDHLFFAEKLAKSHFRKTPPQVQLDELISAAYMGLVDAAKRYDGRNDFKIFARWRIVGEIKDYLRSLKWDRNTNKVASIPEGHDIIAEKEPESFDEVLDGFAKNIIAPIAKNIIRMYYGERMPIASIAQKVNLSGARVSQLLKENISVLRMAMSA